MREVSNWSEYNKSLVARGSLTLWFDESSTRAWTDWKRPKTSRRGGRPGTYGDAAILCALTLRYVFHLPLRATEGFLRSLLKILKIDLPCPSYSTLAKRSQNLDFSHSAVLPKDGRIDIVIDSTGLKVYGEGEWKVKKHGADKRRVWRKLHLAIDPESSQIVLSELTDSNHHDSLSAARMLKGMKGRVGKVYGDGAYDNSIARKAIQRAGGKAIVPPRSGAALNVSASEPWQKQRNRDIKKRWSLGSSAKWKRDSGYHRRSLVETAMGRFKSRFGGSLRSRRFDNQEKEVGVKASILNKMTLLGMPKRL